MKLNRVARTAAASAVVLLVAACGGGDGDGGSTAQASLEVSGTAATGLALADSAVEVKCATGSGTATTDAQGAYTLSLVGGALPCMIRVTGTAGGVEVTLHSVTERGTEDGDTTKAVANVTPLTEMIVAQLTASLPADVFAGFNADAAGGITQAKLATATTALLDALKIATGIDLGDVDPFKTELVAATQAAPDAGNDYDKLLDELGEKVAPESLAAVVDQIVAGASSDSTATLEDAMDSVAGGYLPGCPIAMSGKYRTLDYYGRSFVRQLDFKTMKFNRGDGVALFDMSADPAKPCEFAVTGTGAQGEQVRMDVVIGASGAGAYNTKNITTDRSVTGYIFPAQAHKAAALAGSWTYLQSGYLPGDGVSHFPGKLTFKEGGAVETCDTAPTEWTPCVSDPEVNMTVAERTDGGFNLVEGEPVAQFYGYRAPNGALNLFGTTNPAGTNNSTTEQTSIIATKLQTQTATVGAKAEYWDVMLNRSNGVNHTTVPAADSNTVKSIGSDGVVTRVRASDGREDRVRLNRPLDGLRLREPGTWNGSQYAGVVQFPMAGLGIVTSVNSQPSTQSHHLYVISVSRK